MKCSYVLPILPGLVLVILLAIACNTSTATPSPVLPSVTPSLSTETLAPPPHIPPPTDTTVAPTSTPEPTPTTVSLSAAEILDRARSAEDQLRSASVTYEQEVVAPGGSTVLQCAGSIEFPARLSLTCDTAGTKIEMVLLGEVDGYLRQAGDEMWLRVPEGAMENPLGTTTLEQIAPDALLLDEETIDGVESYVIQSDLDLGQLFSSEPQTLQMLDLQDSGGSIKSWIGKDDFLPRRYEVSMTLAGAGFKVDSTMTLAQGDFDQPVTIPEPVPYAAQLTMATSDPVYQIAFSPDGRTLAACDDDAFIYLWSTQDPEVGGRYIDHPELLSGATFLAADFYSLTFSPDSQTLAAGSLGEVLLYTLADLAIEPVSLPVAKDVNVNAVAFSPDGGLLAAGGDDDLVYLWHLAEPDTSPTILEGHEGPIRDLVFVPDGETLVSASEDTTIRLWALKNLDADPTLFTGHEMPVYDVDVSNDGTTLVSVGFKDPVYAWSLERPDARPDLLVKSEDPSIGKYPTLALALSPDGKLLATSEVYGEVRLWAAPNFTQPYTTFSTGNQYDIMSLDFSPDGRYLAAGQGSNMVHIWDFSPGTLAEEDDEAVIVSGLTAREVLARNGTAMEALQTVRVTMTVDDEYRDPAEDLPNAELTRIMTVTTDLRQASDVHGWWEAADETQEILQLDGGPIYMRGEPDDAWESRAGWSALGPLPGNGLFTLSTPTSLAKIPRFEAIETAREDEPYQIAFAVRPREFFALEPMLADLATATRTQIIGKAWIGRDDLLTQRVVYDITLKTPYVDRTVTYILNLTAFDEPVEFPDLEK